MEFDKKDRMKSILIELISSFIREEANPNPLITVTNLVISKGSRDVTVLITTIPDERQDDALIFLRRKGTDLRNYIKKNSRLRYIPNFSFEVDYGERHRQNIDMIVKDIEEEKKG